jgi:hypothetical protein
MNLLNELDSFKNNQKIISYNQTTNDIINAILRQHNKSMQDYDKLYCYFDGGNVQNTAKRIFNYLKENIKYSIEPDNLQTVGTPAYILALKKGDCKHMSLMFAGLLDAYRRNTGQKFDLAYRFASYDGSKSPEHVFVVINPGSENEIWCDAVLDYFNEKKQPNYYKDKKLQNMALMALSGINYEQRQPQQQMNGVLDVLQTGAGAVPGGQSISALIGLVSGLFAGHSDSYLLDHAIIDKDWNKAMGIYFTWYQQYGFDVTKKPWSKKGTNQGVSKEVPEPFMSLNRFEWLPLIYQQTKNADLGNLINEAIKQGYLDKKYSVFFTGGGNANTANTGKSNFLTDLFGGGFSSTTNGNTSTPPYVNQPQQSSGISTPLILGGVAAVGLIVYFISKKKK